MITTERGAAAERAYRTILGRFEFEDSPETAIADLVCDLHHLFDQYGADWQTEVLDRADLNYRAERG